jgi:RNA polymerase sigma factor for flagellar operon FliA
MSDRDLCILSLECKVRRIANIMLKRLSQSNRAWQYEDFVQAGWVGAIHAVDAYNVSKGVLDTYADWRIRGAILDYMRECDHLKRDHRKQLVAKNALPKNFSLDKIKEEKLKFQVEDVKALRSFGVINVVHDVLVLLRRADLSDRCRQVLLDYYWQEMSMKEIGSALKVVESRVSQLHTVAIAKMRTAIA